jgi:hypothetical protein
LVICFLVLKARLQLRGWATGSKLQLSKPVSNVTL